MPLTWLGEPRRSTVSIEGLTDRRLRAHRPHVVAGADYRHADKQLGFRIGRHVSTAYRSAQARTSSVADVSISRMHRIDPIFERGIVTIGISGDMRIAMTIEHI
jgi:hypothetical protein